eukprot:TRINITY_DN5134_c0_g5_i1.p2 TRINITY_DN5134_c0_g5~~TRINITY_DN5134_c0_g5_i1.p2  ORF type:complete len:198 (-),score=-0.46 TRINITY_DN5134_c0_g5_i1:388-930(-)
MLKFIFFKFREKCLLSAQGAQTEGHTIQGPMGAQTGWAGGIKILQSFMYQSRKEVFQQLHELLTNLISKANQSLFQELFVELKSFKFGAIYGNLSLKKIINVCPFKGPPGRLNGVGAQTGKTVCDKCSMTLFMPTVVRLQKQKKNYRQNFVVFCQKLRIKQQGQIRIFTFCQIEAGMCKA